MSRENMAPTLTTPLIAVMVLSSNLAGIPSLHQTHAEVQSTKQPPLLSTAPNRRVIVFDNDTLDKMFGKSRRSAANETDPAKIPGIPGKSDFPAVGPNRSLLSAIGRGTSAKRAAALRLVESGRTLIQAGENRRAVAVLERALSLEASPFVYFYLARAHYYTADYQRAAEFVEIAEALFYQQPDWTEELLRLKATLSIPRGGPEIRPRQNIGWAVPEAR